MRDEGIGDSISCTVRIEIIDRHGMGFGVHDLVAFAETADVWIDTQAEDMLVVGG